MIVGIVGDIGSGKSHYQLKHALEQCNKKHKRLVTNFKINRENLQRYCHSRKLHWIGQQLYHRNYRVLNCVDQADVLELLQLPSSVVCLDEAGIFFNARGFRDTPKDLLMDLCQSRKNGADLLWSAQFDSQVDKQFRMLTQFFVFCQGYSVWSKRLKNQAFKWKSYHHFKASQYEEFSNNPKARNSVIKTWWMAFSNEVGPLSKDDKFLFECYDSFTRLDKQAASVVRERTQYTDDEYWQIYRCVAGSVATWKKERDYWKYWISYNPMFALSLSPRRLRNIYRS